MQGLHKLWWMGERVSGPVRVVYTEARRVRCCIEFYMVFWPAAEEASRGSSAVVWAPRLDISAVIVDVLSGAG